MKTNELSDGKLKILSGLAILVIGCLCYNGGTTGRAQATQSPQLQEVVKLTQAKMSDDVILQYIKNSGATYSLSADDILYLNNQGVSQPVISALLQAKSSGAPAPAPVATPTTPAPPIAPPQVSPYPGQAVVAAPEVAPLGSEISLSYFQTQLAPYGNWVEVPGEGLCWVPSVQATVPDWRPYFNEGHWVYTDEGWSWQSDYPWGEYAFHYGRWFRDVRYGWTWRPGYNWGPAWVSWRHAEVEGFAGWAPLPPSARFEAGVGLMWDGRVAVDADFGLAPDMYVFIPFDHFWAHNYVGFRAPLWRTHDLFRVSLVANHYGFVGGRFMFGGIGRDRVAALTHHEVRVERVEFHDSHIARSREIEHSHVSDFHGGAVDHGRPVQSRDAHDTHVTHDTHDAGKSSKDHDTGH